jgi:hypothetical protein
LSLQPSAISRQEKAASANCRAIPKCWNSQWF